MQDHPRKIELLKRDVELQAQIKYYGGNLIRPLKITYRYLHSGLRAEKEMVLGYLKCFLMHQFVKCQLQLLEVHISWLTSMIDKDNIKPNAANEVRPNCGNENFQK